MLNVVEECAMRALDVDLVATSEVIKRSSHFFTQHLIGFGSRAVHGVEVDVGVCQKFTCQRPNKLVFSSRIHPSLNQMHACKYVGNGTTRYLMSTTQNVDYSGMRTTSKQDDLVSFANQ